MQKQVEKAHYAFSKYVSKRRWISMWHQLNEVLALEPKTILEIGPGPGGFKALASLFGPKVETLDVDPELKPDHVGSVDEMSFPDDAFDVVCAFQMLEHVPYEKSLKILQEMTRVAKKGVVISLPDARPAWSYSLYIPLLGTKTFHINRPWLGPKIHKFNGEHYWEINKNGYLLKHVMSDFQRKVSFNLLHSFRVDEFPYHRFFVFLNNEK